LKKRFSNFVKNEWIFVVSFFAFLVTTFFSSKIPHLSLKELEVILILFALFVVVNGLQNSKFLLKIAQKIEQGDYIALKLIMSSFFLSMFVTNDIALLVIVPLTLSLNIKNKDILVIFEALSANAGSALTPIGNPQNLFIYWYYDISIIEFFKIIYPFVITWAIIFIIVSFFIKTTKTPIAKISSKYEKKAYIYIGLFVLLILAIFHLLNLYILVLVVIVYALKYDKKSLKIDYFLLFSFLLLFMVSNNLKDILENYYDFSNHLFTSSILLSQIISNVPTALLLSKFSSNYQELLWGVNVGGFGSLFSSLANLIAYKFYVQYEHKKNMLLFTLKFFAIGYFALFISILIYYFLG